MNYQTGVQYKLTNKELKGHIKLPGDLLLDQANKK